MFQYICEWMQRIAYYLVIVNAILHMIPGEEYQRFIRFFTGLILVLLMIGPILRLFDGDLNLSVIYDQAEYETSLGDIRNDMEQSETEEEPLEETPKIQVGEIKIGR